MATSVDVSDGAALSAFLSAHELSLRWRVTLRTVQRRVTTAALEPVGLVGRSPHFYREAVEVAERIYRWRVHKVSSNWQVASWRPYRVCIAHRKGGVAKTTTTYYLGRELVLLGKRVVLRDLDPQRTLSEALRALGAPVDEFDRQPFLRHMVLVPDGSPLPYRPDVELIDTPPDITTAVEGLERADALIVPAQPELLAVIALRDMLTFLRDTADRRPHVRMLGVLPTAVNARWEISRRFLREIEDLAADFGVPVLPAVPESRHVQTFSLRGHLWRPTAERILAAMVESGETANDS
jgi:chromosome partitioning protein